MVRLITGSVHFNQKKQLPVVFFRSSQLLPNRLLPYIGHFKQDLLRRWYEPWHEQLKHCLDVLAIPSRPFWWCSPLVLCIGIRCVVLIILYIIYCSVFTVPSLMCKLTMPCALMHSWYCHRCWLLNCALISSCMVHLAFILFFQELIFRINSGPKKASSFMDHVYMWFVLCAVHFKPACMDAETSWGPELMHWFPLQITPVFNAVAPEGSRITAIQYCFSMI